MESGSRQAYYGAGYSGIAKYDIRNFFELFYSKIN